MFAAILILSQLALVFTVVQKGLVDFDAPAKKSQPKADPFFTGPQSGSTKDAAARLWGSN